MGLLRGSGCVCCVCVYCESENSILNAADRDMYLYNVQKRTSCILIARLQYERQTKTQPTNKRTKKCMKICAYTKWSWAMNEMKTTTTEKQKQKNKLRKTDCECGIIRESLGNADNAQCKKKNAKSYCVCQCVQWQVAPATVPST